MIVYLIENRSADGFPVYYAPGKNNGHGPHAWSTEKQEAIGFAAEEDAQRIIDAMFPRMSETMRPVPHGRPG